MYMRQDAAKALEQMAKAATSEVRLSLKIASAYRSYGNQASAYSSEVESYGQAVADKESARPGYSEHQTGWAADLAPASGNCSVQVCFANTPEAKWLAANAYRFGFVLRYPNGKTSITGYVYEPWHFRYVGKNLAAEMRAKNVQTLEEFFSLPSAPNYN
jgi:D-alanyl-D-alanine carboxypeptidase